MFTARRLPILLVAMLAGLLLFTAQASAQTARAGHTNWGPWSFDWEVRDGAGLNLRNVYYNDEQVFYKASVPVVRVKYNNNLVGPYADQIHWGNLQPIANCGNTKICQRTFRSGGRAWLEIGVFAEIGAYDIYQVWYLSDDGYIHPRLWSRGWQAEVTHDHHTYLRLDPDIDGLAGDQIFLHDDSLPNTGWGADWEKYQTEFNDFKLPAQNRYWFVRDNASTHGLWIRPSDHDGKADGFAPNDAAGRRWRLAEDEAWPFGARGHLCPPANPDPDCYHNNETIAEEDVVFWYISHLRHPWVSEEESKPDDWHWSGPWLQVHR